MAIKTRYGYGLEPKKKGTRGAGSGAYNQDPFSKDPIRRDRSVDSAGNPTAKPRQLNWDTLEKQTFSGKFKGA